MMVVERKTDKFEFEADGSSTSQFKNKGKTLWLNQCEEQNVSRSIYKTQIYFLHS